MYTSEFQTQLATTLEEIERDGLFKKESQISSPQDAEITLDDGRRVINMCANNYLGLSNHPEVREAAREAIDEYGFGLSSVRFICGTQTLHRRLEEALTEFLGDRWRQHVQEHLPQVHLRQIITKSLSGDLPLSNPMLDIADARALRKSM